MPLIFVVKYRAIDGRADRMAIRRVYLIYLTLLTKKQVAYKQNHIALRHKTNVYCPQ